MNLFCSRHELPRQIIACIRVKFDSDSIIVLVLPKERGGYEPGRLEAPFTDAASGDRRATKAGRTAKCAVEWYSGVCHTYTNDELQKNRIHVSIPRNGCERRRS